MRLSQNVSRAKAIATPFVDALLTGGLSLVALALVFALAPRPLRGHDYGAIWVLGCLINWPHFIASYRLLYGTRESIQRYRAASTWVPALLGAYVLVSMLLASEHPALANSLIVVGSVYLARHYTGQTWGMMATFSHLAGAPFSDGERRLVRLSLDLLMVWHGLWAAMQTVGLVSLDAATVLARLYPLTHWLRMIALVVGAVGLGRHAHRHGKLPPARVLLPWAAVNVWYALLAEDASALLAVQLGHALQYLIFPARIELNRAHRTSPTENRKLALFSYVGWTIAGVALFEGLEPLFTLGFGATGGSGPLPGVVSTAIISAIGIHHYFIDGALYKLRNPEVRRDLFAHLEQPAPPSSAAA